MQPERTEKFVKHDGGKLRFSLLPLDALGEIVRVLMYGAAKYTPNNWLKGAEWSRYYDACQRHLTSWWSGKNKDKESRLSHLAHAGCCILFLLAYELRKIGRDDRQP